MQKQPAADELPDTTVLPAKIGEILENNDATEERSGSGIIHIQINPIGGKPHATSGNRKDSVGNPHLLASGWLVKLDAMTATFGCFLRQQGISKRMLP